LKSQRYTVGADVDTISATELEEYLRCGLLYFLRRELKHRTTTPRLAIGNAVHEAQRHDLEHRMRGETLRIDELVAIGEDHLRAELAASETHDLDRGRAIEDVYGATQVYATRVSPELQPIGVESALAASVSEGLAIVGTVDVLEERGLGDLKTGQPWSAQRVAASRQLTAYSILFRAAQGEYPRRLWIDSIWRRKSGGVTSWQYTRHRTTRTDEDRRAYLETVHRARAAINAGIALPAPEAAWYCSRTWCPVWSRCPAAPRAGGTDDE